MSTDFTSQMNGQATDYKSKLPVGEQQFEHYAQAAGERIGMMSSSLAKTAGDSVRVSREYVMKNPGRSVAIAVAAGFVTGGLLTMISRSRRS